MTSSRQLSPYQMFAAVRPRLLNRPADMGAVTLLGQAVSDVLDDGCPESDVLQMIADLESARSDAVTATINEQWQLPLTSFLGLLRQNVHNRTVQAAAINPSSTTLRDKVLAAIDAGVDTPTEIGEHVHSPTTVVSRVLRQLVDEGRVEPALQGEDRRRRHYRLADATAHVDETAQAAAAEEAALSSPARGLSNIAALLDFAEAQTQFNAHTAAALLPDLIAAGSNARLDPALRVGALGVAGVIMRSTDTGAAREDAVDLAETTDRIARLSDEKLVRARGAYELARAGLFAYPDQPRTYLDDLKRAENLAGEELAASTTSAPARIRLGWCAYTRCLINLNEDPVVARPYARLAVRRFREAGFSYGEAAALTILTRVHYDAAAGEDKDEPALLALQAVQALSIANSHGYLRIMAESSYWAGRLLSRRDPIQAVRLLANAEQQFQAVDSPHWQRRSRESLDEVSNSAFGLTVKSGELLAGNRTSIQEGDAYILSDRQEPGRFA